MGDQDRSKEDLIHELSTLRQEVAALESLQGEFKKTEERLAGLAEALMSLGPDAFDNMNRLVEVCRKLMGATCAQYDSLEHGILYSLDQTSAADFGTIPRPEGHALRDMIKEAGESTVVLRNLPQTEWARLEPMVTIHNLQTCIGQAVRSREDFMGALCVAFQEDFVPTSMDKSVVRAIAVAIGAGERRLRVQTALRESEAKYRAIFENAAVGISLKDSSGRFLEANSTLLRMLGHTRDELTRLTYLDVTHPDDIPASRMMHAALVSGDVGSYRMRKRFFRTDRSVLWGDASVTAIRDARGKHLLTVGVLVDISEHKLTEETALREQNFSNMTIDALRGVFYLLDYRLRYIRWNKNFETVSGYSGNEIATMHPLDFFEGADRRIIEEGIQEIWANGEASREADLATKDGRKIPYLFTGKVVTLDQGRFIIGLGIDISASKAAEESLSQLEEKSRSIIESMGDGYYEVDLQGNFTFLNDPMCEILGSSREELIGKNYRSIQGEQDAKMAYEAFHEVYKTGRPSKSTSLWFARKDGERRNVDVSVSTIKDSQGRTKGFLGICRDNTERTKAENALRESEQLLQSILSASPIGISLTQAGKMKWVNEAWLEILGFRHEHEVVGQHAGMIYCTPEEFERAAHILHQDLHMGAVTATDAELKRQDGSCIHGHIRMTALNPSDLSHGTISAITDITERKQAEVDLLVQREKFQMLSEHAPLGMVMIGEDGTFEYVNPKFREIVGYDLSEVPNGREWFRKAYPDPPYRREAISAWVNDSKGDTVGVTERRTFTVTCKDGGRKTIHFTPVRLSTGVHVLTMEDITAREKAAEALRIKDSAMAASITGIAITDFHGNITYANPAAFRLWGYDDEKEVLGNCCSGFLESDLDLEKYREILLEAGSWVGDMVAKKRDDSRVDLQVAATLVRDASGKPIAMMGSFLDISDRKRAEQALRESEERMRLLIEASPIGIGIIREDKYAYVNPALTRMMGCEAPSELIGTSPLAFVAPEDRDLIQLRGWGKAEGLKKVESYRVGIIRRNGERFEVSIWPGRIDYLGKPAQFAFMVDVTEENRLRAQLVQSQKLEAIGTLAGGIVHDFNNLLTIVQGYSELLLLEMEKGDPRHVDLEKIREASVRGGELVRGMLAFSRKADSSPRPMNLNNEVERVRKLLSRTIPKMIEIELHLSNDLAAINADPSQMGQVLMNLAVNARDAMAKGGILTFATQNVHLDKESCRNLLGARPGEYVLLSVSDTGEGMDQETLGQIFVPFFTTKEAGKGTGLGLATVYGIIEQHGGHIMCESEPGAGTTFRIYLPVLDRATMVPESTGENSVPARGTETILLVDDEEFILDLGSKFLQMNGYTVLTAHSGPEALSLYVKEGKTISVVILDLIMPEMGGEACLEEILKINKDAKIIISSGATLESLQKETLEARAKGFVGKPFQPNDMLRALRKAIDSE